MKYGSNMNLAYQRAVAVRDALLRELPALAASGAREIITVRGADHIGTVTSSEDLTKDRHVVVYTCQKG